MICPYRPYCKETFVRHSTSKLKTKITTMYTPQPCLKNICPFYSDGSGYYREGACIKVELEIRE